MRDAVAGGPRVLCGWMIIVSQEFLDLLYYIDIYLPCCSYFHNDNHFCTALHCCPCVLIQGQLF
uniref:Uncharacterized protein n=1 Tax=Arundo donax TaxID=35708 RepID=A0A0A9CDG6_ARUDO